MLKSRTPMLLGFILFAAVMKLMPYVAFQVLGAELTAKVTFWPWNFSPMYGICLFGGAMFADRRWAFAVPLLAMLAADFGIAAISRFEYGFYGVGQIVTYLAIASVVAVGFLLRKNRGFMRVAGAAVAGTLSFWIISNFGVWLGSTTHAKDIVGLIACYADAIPFYKSEATTQFFLNSAIGTGFYTAFLFNPAVVAWFQRAEESAAVPADVTLNRA